MRRTTTAVQALRRNEKERKGTKESVRNRKPDKLPSPNRRNAHYLRVFPSASHCVASNNHKRFLRRKQRIEQRTRRSNEIIESENDKSASRLPPQGRMQISCLRRNCIRQVACVALARTRKGAEVRKTRNAKLTRSLHDRIRRFLRTSARSSAKLLKTFKCGLWSERDARKAGRKRVRSKRSRDFEGARFFLGSTFSCRLSLAAHCSQLQKFLRPATNSAPQFASLALQPGQNASIERIKHVRRDSEPSARFEFLGSREQPRRRKGRRQRRRRSLALSLNSTQLYLPNPSPPSPSTTKTKPRPLTSKSSAAC